MKIYFKYILALSLIFAITSKLFANEPRKTIVIDMSSNGGPDIAYWRGAQGPGMNGFFDNKAQRECLKIHAKNGMRIYNGTRRLATDPEKADFYIDSLGNPATSPINEYVNIKRYAHSLGIELICMIDGTPSWVIEIERDTFHWGNPAFSEKVEDAIADHAPLPKKGKPMEDFQRLFVEFARESDAAVAPDYHSIWIGTQEIAHTIGWRDGVVNENTKKEAIRRYIDFWVPIADSLRMYGKKVGGIQLNSSNADIYNYAVDYMIEKNLKLDYLTYQFYQWGKEKPMQKAAQSVRRYRDRMNMPNTQLIIDRGSHGKLTRDLEDGSKKLITFLKGEKFCMDQADVVYAYTLDAEVGKFTKNQKYNNLEWKTKYWLMNCGDPKSPNKRRSMIGLSNGLDGFVTTKENDLYGVIWNTGVTGSNPQKIKLKLQNTQAYYTEAPKIYKASGNALSEVKCRLRKNTISGVTLCSDEYILIELSADQVKN